MLNIAEKSMEFCKTDKTIEKLVELGGSTAVCIRILIKMRVFWAFLAIPSTWQKFPNIIILLLHFYRNLHIMIVVDFIIFKL